MTGTQGAAATVLSLDRVNDKSILSVVLGFAGLYAPIPLVLGVLAIVFGQAAREEIRMTGTAGSSLATIGIALGWVQVAMWLFVGVVLFVFFVAAAAAA